MNKNIKRLSIIALIIAAIILIYGFIDANSYHAGYTAGYAKISRSVDAACMQGRVVDTILCDAAEVAFYENQNRENQNGDGNLYFAQISATLVPSVTTSTITASPNLSKRKRRGATVSASAVTPATAAPTFPAGFSPFIWMAKLLDAPQQSSLVSNVTAALDAQKMIAAQCPKAKILLYAGGLPETEDKNETKGLASCPPAGIPDGLLEGWSGKDAAGGVYAVKKTGTNVLDGSLGLVMISPPPSFEEGLKAKALGTNCASAGKNSDACLAMDPYCVMSVAKRDGSGTVNADSTAGCTDSETKIKRVSFNPSDPCSQTDIQDRMLRARMITGTSGEKICSDNIAYLYLQEDKASGKLIPLGVKGSLSELLRSPGLKDFAQKAGATAVSVPVAAPVASTPCGAPPATPCSGGSMPYMPSGGYMPGGCQSPMHWDSSRNMCVTAIYRPSLLGQLVDIIFGLFRRPADF